MLSAPPVTGKATSKQKKLDSLAESARKALDAGDFFAADNTAFEAVSLAYAMDEYGLMPPLLEVLKEARGRRFRQAIDIGKLIVLDDIAKRIEILETEDASKLTPGCYLLQPPLVGADGRNFRDHFFSLGVPAMFIVREPTTKLGLWPIVMIGPITVRTRIEPPENEVPTIEWLEEAAYELGDSALETINADAAPPVRVVELFDRLGTVVLHDQLIDLLAETCVEAQTHIDAVRAAKEAKKRIADAKTAGAKTTGG